MTIPTTQDLKEIVSEANLDNILLFSSEGYLIESNEFEYDGNYAAMCGVLTVMCKELIQDLEYGELDKIMVHADKGLLMVYKVHRDYYIASFTKDGSKLGLLMKTMDNIISKLTQ